MSRRCVGYEGEGRHRKPRYLDEGPASTAVSDPVAAIGVLSATQVRGSIAISGGAGQVERRQATEAQMATWREEAAESRAEPPKGQAVARILAEPVRSHIPAAERMQASRERGAPRHVEVMAEREALVHRVEIEASLTAETEAEVEAAVADAERAAEILYPLEEEIVSEPQEPAHIVSSESPPEAAEPGASNGAHFITDSMREQRGEPVADTLAILADALVTAIESWDEKLAADRLADQATIRWTQARVALDSAYRALEVPTVVELAAAIAPDNLTSTDDVNPAPSTASPSDPLALLEELQEEEARASVALDGETQVVEPVPGYDARAAAATIVADRAAATEELEPEAPILVNGGGSERTEDATSRLTTHQRRVLESTIKHDGDRRAAAEDLGLAAYQNIEIALEAIGRKGLLPADLIPKLPARFAKYQGV